MWEAPFNYFTWYVLQITSPVWQNQYALSVYMMPFRVWMNSADVTVLMCLQEVCDFLQHLNELTACHGLNVPSASIWTNSVDVAALMCPQEVVSVRGRFADSAHMTSWLWQVLNHLCLFIFIFHWDQLPVSLSAELLSQDIAANVKRQRAGDLSSELYHWSVLTFCPQP